MLKESFKKYDIRGTGISEEDACKLGKIFARKHGDVIVGRDKKGSSRKLCKAFIEGVKSQGMKAYYLGVVPTDFVSFASKKLVRPSCMITASHLSDEYDGFKFNYDDGSSFKTSDLYYLRDKFFSDDCEQSLNSKGKRKRLRLKKDYIDSLKARYFNFFKKDLKGQKIVLDLKGGVSMAPYLLKELNASVYKINSNGSEPNPENLLELSNKVIELGACLGMAFDYDADRVLVVDENGNYVDPNHISCLIARVYGGPVIASIDSSLVLETCGNVIYSKVGDPYIQECLKSVLCKCKECNPFGSESSGHYTDPHHAWCSSGTLFSAIIAGLALNKNLSELVNSLPKIHVRKEKLDVPNKDAFMNYVCNFVKTNELAKLISDIDGVKFEYRDHYFTIRPSNTEDIIRFHVESVSGLEESIIEEVKYESCYPCWR